MYEAIDICHLDGNASFTSLVFIGDGIFVKIACYPTKQNNINNYFNNIIK